MNTTKDGCQPLLNNKKKETITHNYLNEILKLHEWS